MQEARNGFKDRDEKILEVICNGIPCLEYKRFSSNERVVPDESEWVELTSRPDYASYLAKESAFCHIIQVGREQYHFKSASLEVTASILRFMQEAGLIDDDKFDKCVEIFDSLGAKKHIDFSENKVKQEDVDSLYHILYQRMKSEIDQAKKDGKKVFFAFGEDHTSYRAKLIYAVALKVARDLGINRVHSEILFSPFSAYGIENTSIYFPNELVFSDTLVELSALEPSFYKTDADPFKSSHLSSYERRKQGMIGSVSNLGHDAIGLFGFNHLHELLTVNKVESSNVRVVAMNTFIELKNVGKIGGIRDESPHLSSDIWQLQLPVDCHMSGVRMIQMANLASEKHKGLFRDVDSLRMSKITALTATGTVGIFAAFSWAVDSRPLAITCTIIACLSSVAAFVFSVKECLAQKKLKSNLEGFCKSERVSMFRIGDTTLRVIEEEHGEEKEEEIEIRRASTAQRKSSGKVHPSPDEKGEVEEKNYAMPGSRGVITAGAPAGAGGMGRF